jgi:hypothetical protein
MTGPWKLKRTAQCAACPWKTTTVPERDIPTYDAAKHAALARTICPTEPEAMLAWTMAKLNGDEPTHVFTCHDTDEAHCVGWLHNQLGRGSNVVQRIAMSACTNAHRIRIDGPQHPTFEDTLPR